MYTGQCLFREFGQTEATEVTEQSEDFDLCSTSVIGAAIAGAGA